MIKPNVTTLFDPDQTFWPGVYLTKCQITMIRNAKSSEKFSLPLRLSVVWQMFSAATLKNQFRTLLQSSPLQFILDENYLCTILPIKPKFNDLFFIWLPYFVSMNFLLFEKEPHRRKVYKSQVSKISCFIILF